MQVWPAVRIALNVLLLGGAAWLIFNYQYVVDQYNVWRYEPSSQISAITNRAQLSDEGAFYFYTSHPRLSDKAEFNSECSRVDEQSVILGCYVGQRIYIYNVSDKRLDGVKEVTAAHEMLHAAYDRLEQSEKDRINPLLESEANSIDEKAFKERLAVYKNVGSDERVNELHSILATEVEDLSSELEQYYSQYFTNRKATVGLFKQYEEVFTDLKDEQDRLSKELKQLEKVIKQRSSAYNQDTADLNEDVVSFNNRAENGGFDSQGEFDSERAVLVQRQQELETEYQALNNLIDEFKAKVARLNKLNLQAQSLNRSIDSKLADPPSEPST